MNGTSPFIARRRALCFGALWLAISAGAVAAPGCYGRNCEGTVEFYGSNPGEGQMLDENTWMSGPIEGQWLWFPRQRWYVFDIPALGGRTPELIHPYISGSPNPATAGMTPGSGNIASVFNVRANHVEMKNDSCSDYYLRLAVVAPPFESAPDAGGTDGASPEPDEDSGPPPDDDGGLPDGNADSDT